VFRTNGVELQVLKCGQKLIKILFFLEINVHTMKCITVMDEL
jgi:hypothetical protein